MTKNSKIPRTISFLSGMGLGAGLMYLADPQRGPARRAMMRQKAAHLAAEERRVMRKGARDLQHRSQGLVARLRAAFRSRAVADEVLAERVLARVGHLSTNPRAVEVSADQGHVTLSGAIYASEAEELLHGVRKVRGVRRLEDRLERHRLGDVVPSLQHPPRVGPRVRRPTPATRLIAGAAGASALMVAIRRRGAAGVGLALLGSGLLLRGLSGRPARPLLGIAATRWPITVQKTIHIAAPLDEVFVFWQSFDNFPQFMKYVREVELLGDGLSRWVLEGPGGVTISWTAETTAVVPGELISWRTVAGSSVEHEGSVRFERAGEAATRLSVRMSYQPPAGALGHVLARILSTDPKQAMDEDLIRLKSLLEQGKTRVEGRPVTLDELR